MQKINSLVLGVLLLVSPAFALAQESDPTSPATALDNSGVISCFDYYKSGSVKADIQPSIGQATPGTTLFFTGNVTNENDYPVVEGKLSAKVFRRDKDTLNQGNGNPVVDQFVIAEKMQIGAKASKEVSFDWKIPVNARGGAYYIAYFFTSSERYSLMGLSFTDDVIGDQAEFIVTSDGTPQNVEFDKNTALLNDKRVLMAEHPLHFNGNEPVDFKVSIVNPSDQIKTIPLQWNQYNWDAERVENRKNTKTELITLQPKETKELQYTNITTSGAVNYVTAMVQDGEHKSFINGRYIKDDIEETRMNILSITSFPLVAGKEQSLFACAHSTGLSLVKNNTLILTLKDKEGGVISQYRYDGDISNSMKGFGQKFTPTKDYNYVTLEASLFRGGSEVEKVEVIYDCEAIDSSLCNSSNEKGGFLGNSFGGKAFTIIGIAGLGVVVLIGALIVNSRRRKTIQW